MIVHQGFEDRDSRVPGLTNTSDAMVIGWHQEWFQRLFLMTVLAVTAVMMALTIALVVTKDKPVRNFEPSHKDYAASCFAAADDCPIINELQTGCGIEINASGWV